MNPNLVILCSTSKKVRKYISKVLYRLRDGDLFERTKFRWKKDERSKIRKIASCSRFLLKIFCQVLDFSMFYQKLAKKIYNHVLTKFHGILN